MKVISYSLFGYDKKPEQNCFEFNTYLRGLVVNTRVNRVIYPGWKTFLNIDQSSYESKFQPIYDWLLEKGLIEINIFPNDEPLCRAMLWRLFPCFLTEDNGDWKYTHVLCRDIDSIGTYREAQAVQQWVDEGKVIHCITDSVSHNIPMMGGMIGFQPAWLTERMHVKRFAHMLNKAQGINFTIKGSDQTFLNKFIYPKCADSATEHFVKGMIHNLPEGNGRHYSIPDVPIDVDPVFKFLDTCAGHIGAAGYYEPPMLKFLNTLDPYRDEYKEIESKFPSLFYWSA